MKEETEMLRSQNEAFVRELQEEKTKYSGNRKC